MEDLVRQLQTQIFTLAKRMKGDFEARLLETKTGITILPYGVLKSLFGQPQTIHDLAERLSIKPPTLIPAVNTLEKKGYIKRTGDKNDNRKKILTITSKGKKIFNSIPMVDTSDAIGTSAKKIGKAKIETLTKLLTELNTTFSKK